MSNFVPIPEYCLQEQIGVPEIDRQMNSNINNIYSNNSTNGFGYDFNSNATSLLPMNQQREQQQQPPHHPPPPQQRQPTTLTHQQMQQLSYQSSFFSNPTLELQLAASDLAPSPRKKCRCRNSRCLKRYCDCFASKSLCENCECVGCENNLAHKDIVQKNISQILEVNPVAFKSKISTDVSNGQSVVLHDKGCRCKKSACRKKYCECFQANVLCNKNCACNSCQNNEAAYNEESLSQSQESRNGNCNGNGNGNSNCNGYGNGNNKECSSGSEIASVPIAYPSSSSAAASAQSQTSYLGYRTSSQFEGEESLPKRQRISQNLSNSQTENISERLASQKSRWECVKVTTLCVPFELDESAPYFDPTRKYFPQASQQNQHHHHRKKTPPPPSASALAFYHQVSSVTGIAPCVSPNESSSIKQ